MRMFDNTFTAVQALIMVMCMHCTIIMAVESIPSNYDEIKALLDRYTAYVDYPSADVFAARTELRLKADDAIPALMVLFNENEDQKYRSVIIASFYYATKSQDRVVSFLLDHLKASPDQWRGKIWIRQAMKLLAKLDPDKTKAIARKAMSSPDLEIQITGVIMLGTIGDIDDIERLNSYAAKRQSGNPEHAEDELSSAARTAASQLDKRFYH